MFQGTLIHWSVVSMTRSSASSVMRVVSSVLRVGFLAPSIFCVCFSCSFAIFFNKKNIMSKIKIKTSRYFCNLIPTSSEFERKYTISTAESAFLSRDRPVTVPSPFRHHPVTVPRRSKSSNVLKRPLALFVLRTLKDGVGRFRTL